MSFATQPAAPTRAALWTGRVISALVVLFMLFDAGIKLLETQAAVTGTVQAGFPAATVFWIGAAALVSILLYLAPRTAVLGAIVLTGYLGGAAAANVRLESAWWIFPVVLGILAWGGLFLREPRLRALIPLRRLPEADALPSAPARAATMPVAGAL